MSYHKNIAVITSTRADYGLLQPLLAELENNKLFNLQLIVTGTHLSHEFGYTVNQIEADGFEIFERIDSLVSNDSDSAIGKTAGLALMGIVDSLIRCKADLVVLLGDRYEILSAAIAANICRIPIAHLHGGEITEGAYDNGFRHAITKMSHIHFTSSEQHRNRVIQMGESTKNVYNVGAIGIDNIKNIKPLTKRELEENLGIKFNKSNLLITVHPETLESGTSEKIIKLLLSVLDVLKDTFLVFTGTNADSEGRIINNVIKEYCNKNPQKALFVDSLGQKRYISMLYIVDAVIGNSSSGIIEVPSFNIPTLNLGDRQKGRQSAASVISCKWDEIELKQKLSEVLQSSGIQTNNPYGNGNTAKKIIEILSGYEDYKSLIKKQFNNIEVH